MTQFGFGSAQRLLCAQEFKAVFDGAIFKVHQPHFLLLAIVNSSTSTRLGLVVAKKKLRRAHERNRVKRLTRESFRLYQAQLPCLDIVVMPKLGIDQIDNQQLYTELKQAWEKLARQANKQKHSAVSCRSKP